MPRADGRIELGRITGPWGVAGWVRIHSHTEPPENIFEYQPWRAAGRPAGLQVLEWRRQGSRLVARLDGVDDRNAAQALAGVTLSIDPEKLPEPEAGTWYWRDLVGLEVVNRTGVALGRVSDLIDAGAHDVLVIRPQDSGPEILVPFVLDRVVDSVDLRSGRIQVDWDPEWV